MATAVVAAGVGALVAGAPLVLTVLTVAGSAYLVWLGIGMLRRPSIPQAGQELGSGSWVRQALKGAGISGPNPKVLLLFLALLPQFTDPHADWPIAGQIVALGLVHVASCAAVYTGVGAGARVVLRTPAHRRLCRDPHLRCRHGCHWSFPAVGADGAIRQTNQRRHTAEKIRITSGLLLGASTH